MRILVDTNVFLDFFLHRESYDDAVLFFKLSNHFHDPLYVTSMSLRDIGYASQKAFHDKKMVRTMQFKIYEFCDGIIDITSDDTINSLYDDEVDFEDSLIKEAAERSMIDIIVTNNIKDYRKLGFPSLSPKQLNEIYLSHLGNK